MEKLREIFYKLIEKPLYTAIAGFVIGLIIGLPILGWWLWPVKWKDADASFLRQDLKEQYLCMVVDSYNVNQDANLAAARIDSLGVDLKTTPFLFDNLAAGGCNYAPSDKVVMGLKSALLAAEPAVIATEEVKKDAEKEKVEDKAAETAAPAEEEDKVSEPAAPAEVGQSTVIPLPGETVAKEKKGGSVLLLSLLCALFLVIGGALVYIFFIRPRRTQDDVPPTMDDDSNYVEEDTYDEAPDYPAVVTPPPPPVFDEEPPRVPVMDYFREPEVTAEPEVLEAPVTPEVVEEIAKTPVVKAAAVAAPVARSADPVAHFMTTYVIGDDLYDDSFSIDAPNGSFLGECGVGILDTIGVGDPKKVTAFEVWLFDKNDIQTVTKVLLSAHAMNDSGIKQRLASKGELVQIESGQQLLLETATLQLEARIIEMVYGQGALPSGSFFQRMTLELSVWPK